MLRKIRLTLAILFFLAVTGLFLDFTGSLHAWLGWTAKIQFLPALLALNVGVVVLLIALTLLLGRVYCSVICPLGVMQDIVSWISGRRKKKKFRFSYSPEKRWLRYGVLGLFVIALVTGIGSFVALLAPYSSYGRIAANLFAPVYRWGNNLRTYAPLKPLTEDDFEFLQDTATRMMQLDTIPCNDCKYCMPCPYGLDIPAILLHYNKCLNEGNVPENAQSEKYREARRAFLIGYDRSVPKLRQASHCIGCNQCSVHCPQRIDIPKELQRIDAYVERLKQEKG